MDEIAIEVKDIERRFGKSVAVNGLSFMVEHGAIFGFIGPNGAGKTTTIRILLGICRPDSGTAYMLERNVMSEFDVIGPRIGIVLENTGLYEDLTGLENLDFHGRLYPLDSHQRKNRIQLLLKDVGLQDRSDDLVKSYSKGMKQRLAMALALINDPDILLLDEPFDGIDTETHRHLSELLNSLSVEKGKSILFTSHNLHDVEKLATKVAIISKGQLIACDTMETLMRKIHHDSLKIEFVNPINHESIKQVLTSLGISETDEENGNSVILPLSETLPSEVVLAKFIEAHIPISEAVKVKSSLEEVYFSLLENPTEITKGPKENSQ